MSVENRGISQTPSFQGVQAPAQPAGEDVKAVEVKGEYKGMEVQVDGDAGSSMADAAEELTFSLAETVEKKVFERKVDRQGPAKVTVEEAHKAEEAAKKLKDMNPEKLKQFLADIRENRPNDSGELAKQSKNAFPDPSERQVALEYLRDTLVQSGEDPDMVAFIDTVLITMEAEEGPAIRAGFNINNVAITDLAGGGEHREVYRENVLSFRNAGETFSGLLKDYGEDGVGKMLDYVSQSLSVDMESLNPSTGGERLALVNDGISTARSLANTLDGAKELLKSVGNRNGTAGQVVDTLLQVKDGSVDSGAKLRGQLPLAGRGNPTQDVEFLNGFMSLARSLPDRLFGSGSARQAMLDVIQSALDSAVEMEEEMLDSM